MCDPSKVRSAASSTCRYTSGKQGLFGHYYKRPTSPPVPLSTISRGYHTLRGLFSRTRPQVALGRPVRARRLRTTYSFVAHISRPCSSSNRQSSSCPAASGLHLTGEIHCRRGLTGLIFPSASQTGRPGGPPNVRLVHNDALAPFANIPPRATSLYVTSSGCSGGHRSDFRMEHVIKTGHGPLS
ncbi:hypothetical protein BC826DRAFT_156864 [Russula brevipes]|nr:hypothetical protein BC826DRAFT_156864 [Russula brevipes]